MSIIVLTILYFVICEGWQLFLSVRLTWRRVSFNIIQLVENPLQGLSWFDIQTCMTLHRLYPDMHLNFLTSSGLGRGFQRPSMVSIVRVKNMLHRLGPNFPVFRIWKRCHFKKLPSLSHFTLSSPHFSLVTPNFGCHTITTAFCGPTFVFWSFVPQFQSVFSFSLCVFTNFVCSASL